MELGYEELINKIVLMFIFGDMENDEEFWDKCFIFVFLLFEDYGVFFIGDGEVYFNLFLE